MPCRSTIGLDLMRDCSIIFIKIGRFICAALSTMECCRPAIMPLLPGANSNAKTSGIGPFICCSTRIIPRKQGTADWRWQPRLRKHCWYGGLEGEIYAGKANHIKVRHRHGKIVSVVEIVSPGNKGSKTAFRTFIEKSAELIRQGVHLLVIDVLPPGKRDPHGRDSQGYINVHGISENTRRHANAN